MLRFYKTHVTRDIHKLIIWSFTDLPDKAYEYANSLPRMAKSIGINPQLTSEPTQRFDDLRRFYAILDELSRKTNGTRLLSESTGRMNWPVRGVYFFREHGENRLDTGPGPRVVRVGTHALKDGSRTTLWNRLSQHRGQAKTGGGNHRGSIFRLIIGTALMDINGRAFPTWDQGSSAPKEFREKEQPLEKLVSKTIGEMPFLWLAITDDPEPKSLRGYPC